MLNELQLERWKQLRDEMLRNDDFMQYNAQRDKVRMAVREEILSLWNQYRNAEVDSETFRSVFDRRTRTDWDVFGLKGPSGAMFLNKLIKYIGNENELGRQIQSALSVPASRGAGYQQMRDFQAYLEEIVESQQASRRQLEPARLSFLLSAFWHMQVAKDWPIYYLSARGAMESEGLFQRSGDPTEDYFAFREVYLNLMHELELSSWELEHLCVWYQERTVETSEPKSEVAVVESEAVETHDRAPDSLSRDDSQISHEVVQLWLAKLGRHFGYKVWIAANDKNRVAQGERLGTYSIDELPHLNGVGPKSRRMIELIDVLWLKGTSRIVAAFEVESTTSIYSGLLRMSDLSLALDNFNFPIYLAVPGSRAQHVVEQLSRLTFQRLELHKVCRFFTFEKLMADADSIMRFASDGKAIDAISRQVGDISEDGYY